MGRGTTRGRRRHDRFVLLLVVALVGAIVPLAARAGTNAEGPPPAGDVLVSHRVEQGRSEIREYWTEERMREARPLELKRAGLELEDRSDTEESGPDGDPVTIAPYNLPAAEEVLQIPVPGYPYTRSEVTDTQASPQRAVGKIYYTKVDQPNPGNYVCSGGVVSAPTQNLIWTAAHCVHGGVGQTFFTNFKFVPAFKDGVQPHGEWTAGNMFVPASWVSSENLRQDYALVSLNNGGTGNQPIAGAVGSFGIKFNEPIAQAYKAYGYPAGSPFTGQKMFVCDASTANQLPLGIGGTGPLPIGIGCDMTGGSSGGPWVVGGQFIESNNSFGITSPAGWEEVMWGPYLNTAALDMYNQVVDILNPGTTPTSTVSPTPTTSPSPSPTPGTVTISNVSVKPNPFKPGGTKVVTLRFTIDMTANLTLNIKNSKGKTIVKYQPTTFDAGTIDATWNGRNKKGKIVPKGKYFFNLTATAGGKTAKVKRAFKIRR